MSEHQELKIKDGDEGGGATREGGREEHTNVNGYV